MPIPIPGTSSCSPIEPSALSTSAWVGEIAPKQRTQLSTLLFAIVGRDPGALVESVLALGTEPLDVNRDLLRADLVAVVDAVLDRPLGEVSIGRLLQDLLGIMRRHRLRLPPALALLAKTITMAEGIGAHLDPSFRLIDAMARFTTGEHSG
ncbi:MAG: hypothetical protein J2O39_00095 [Acidimicrobiales bacterium]|nr:hypothetical protein [Acidimicrobiales bacterium]